MLVWIYIKKSYCINFVIELQTTTVTSLVRTLPRLLASSNFSHIMMPFQEFCKIVLPSKAARQERIDFNIPATPQVYLAGIEETITILPSLQKPRKVTLKGNSRNPTVIIDAKVFWLCVWVCFVCCSFTLKRLHECVWNLVCWQ